MNIGLDISGDTIHSILLQDNEIVKVVEKPVDLTKKHFEEKLMDCILETIKDTYGAQVEGIGLCLPSSVDGKKGVVYDLQKIPFWRQVKIKNIIEDKFHVPVKFNNDINCYAVSEKKHGICNDTDNFLFVTLEKNAGTGVMLNNKLLTGKEGSFDNPTCLSLAYYKNVLNLRKSYLKILDELMCLSEQINETNIHNSKNKLWEEVGILTGKLICILLCNFNPEIIVLGGMYSESYLNYVDTMDSYIRKHLHPLIVLNMIVVTSSVKCPKALGAASLFLN